MMVQAIVFSSYRAYGVQDNCVDLRGIVCNKQTCSEACKLLGYADPVARCSTRSVCCCLVKCCGKTG
ncbi:hypothetical protein QOZ80_8AG0618020 [Eleusine coracana subsp. coracana]|nr:hypothetical protein QOZ80_8AG0618020 [Eleusine coracana subsp. coracana]